MLIELGKEVVICFTVDELATTCASINSIGKAWF